MRAARYGRPIQRGRQVSEIYLRGPGLLIFGRRL